MLPPFKEVLSHADLCCHFLLSISWSSSVFWVHYMARFSIGGNPSAEPTHAGASGAELLPQLPLFFHCRRQVLRRTPQQAPSRYWAGPGIEAFLCHLVMKSTRLVLVLLKGIHNDFSYSPLTVLSETRVWQSISGFKTRIEGARSTHFCHLIPSWC